MPKFMLSVCLDEVLTLFWFKDSMTGNMTGKKSGYIYSAQDLKLLLKIKLIESAIKNELTKTYSTV